MIVHCPTCSNVVLKDLQGLENSTEKIKWSTRCSHCKTEIEIRLEIKRVVIINGKEAPTSNEAKARLLG